MATRTDQYERTIGILIACTTKKMQVSCVSHALPWSTASTASTASAHSKAPLRLSMSQDEPTSKLIEFRAAATSSEGS